MTQPIIATLDEILANREARAERQKAMLAAHHLPLVSFIVNMPGPVKDNQASRTVFRQGLEALTARCARENWKIVELEERSANTGPEALLAVACAPLDLKKATVELEDTHPLGRLFDLDVLSPEGAHLSRQDFGAPARRCLICEKPAAECARSRAHNLDELLRAINTMVAGR